MLDTFVSLTWNTLAVTQPQQFGLSLMEENYDYTMQTQLMQYVHKTEAWA